MKMLLSALFVFFSLTAVAQTATTQALEKKFDSPFSLYFYKNTLRMLNQANDKDFDDLIKDIEKMKFLMIDKAQKSFAAADYKKLLKDYHAEQYDEMMTSRYEGRNFDVYIKEANNKVKGTVILVNDSSRLFVLDILGSVALDKATSLFKVINGSTDIGKKIKDFTSGDGKKQPKPGVKVD